MREMENAALTTDKTIRELTQELADARVEVEGRTQLLEELRTATAELDDLKIQVDASRLQLKIQEENAGSKEKQLVEEREFAMAKVEHERGDSSVMCCR
jgi:DnaJ-domain-containing protein 1